MKSVMVVEDDPDLREMMAHLLAFEGFEAQVASNGHEALQLLKNNLTPGVIVLDLMMPVMDGWTFRERQRRDASLANIPVIVVTAAPHAATHTLDVEEILSKPVDFDRLVNCIRTHCQANHPN
jgi:CheY-like chemotaxis protein